MKHFLYLIAISCLSLNLMSQEDSRTFVPLLKADFPIGKFTNYKFEIGTEKGGNTEYTNVFTIQITYDKDFILFKEISNNSTDAYFENTEQNLRIDWSNGLQGAYEDGLLIGYLFSTMDGSAFLLRGAKAGDNFQVFFLMQVPSTNEYGIKHYKYLVDPTSFQMLNIYNK